MSRLQCPYPGCEGGFQESRDPLDRLLICPVCRKPAARCDRVDHDDRCKALNRPLAHFCRYCKQGLQPGWAQSYWFQDLGSGVGPGSPLVLGEPESVLCLEGAVSELREVAGRIWIGRADGRFLLIDPFSDQQVLLASPQVWAGSRLRSRTSGVWLLLYSNQGIKYLDLLSLDDQNASLGQVSDLWTAGADRQMLSNPVLLRLPPDRQNPATGLDRLVVWISSGSDGPSLWTKTLSLVGDQETVPRELPLGPLTKEALSSLHDDERITLVEAPDGARDHIVVCSRESLGLVAFLQMSQGPGSRAGPPSYFSLMTKEDRQRRGVQFIHNIHEIPGVVFVPSAAAEKVLGTVYVAGHREDDSGQQERYAISCPRKGLPNVNVVGEGMPLAVEGYSGIQRVLDLAGSSLVLHNELGNKEQRLDLPDLLPLVHRVQVAGRIALCSGVDAPTGSSRWFTQLIDLRDNRLIPERLTAEYSNPHPILMGRYLFAVERMAMAGGPPGARGDGAMLWLTRRTVAPRQLPRG